MDKQFEVFVNAPRGIISLLFDELGNLGIQDLQERPTGVEFTDGHQAIYKTCLWSRLANRVLLKLGVFDIEDEDQLYNEMYAYRWDDLLDSENTFLIDVSLRDTRINHSRYAEQRVKDAIVDYFKINGKDRPNVSKTNPDFRISLYISKGKGTLYLDLSGGSLHQRGYRKDGARAPLKENLAAAMLVRAKWPEIVNKESVLLDPMCGSGTLLIEGAMMAMNKAPGLDRHNFGFTKWKQFKRDVWIELLEEAKDLYDQGKADSPKFLGYDYDAKSISSALENSKRAGFSDLIHFSRSDLKNLKNTFDEKTGLLITNPPYGERLNTLEEVNEIFDILGGKFRDEFKGWRASVITNDLDFTKRLRIHVDKKYTLFNGPIECKFLNFKLTEDNFFKDRTGDEELRGDVEMFANRIRKNLKKIKKWSEREKISCYRIYDNDLPEYAVAIDYYEGNLHVQEYKVPKTIDPLKAQKRLKDILKALKIVTLISADKIHLKTRQKQKGNSQYTRKSRFKKFETIHENGHSFYVDFVNYLDIGLFLDHRIIREIIEKAAKDKHFLNLFAYTGSASVYAAAGGAKTTTTIDSTNRYLEWAQENFKLNKLDGRNHEFVKADCMTWPKEHTKKYDLIFLDPPTFSNSKDYDLTLEIQRDHIELIEMYMRLLKKDGLMYFSNNFKKFKMDVFSLSKFDLKDITRKTIPFDYKRNTNIHHCWEIRHSNS